MGQRDGHRRPRRGQNRWIRTPAGDALSDLRDAPVSNKGQLLGLSDSDARPDVHWLPAEASAAIAWHSEAAALETAREQHRELAFARAVPAWRSIRRPCGDTSQSSQAARTGEERRKGRRRRGKFRPGRDLHDPGPARPRDRARQFPRRLEAASDPDACQHPPPCAM